jgi:MFS family permease
MSTDVRATLAGGVEARRMVFLASCLAVFMVSVEATIVATAIPTIVGDLGGLRLFSWVFGIYFLTQAVTIPIYGRLADLFGRRALMVVAVSLFLIGSIMSGFAHDMVMLIVYRGLQGLGAGGVAPLASTMVGDMYRGAERVRVQGYLSSVWGISAVTGPLLGAFILAHVGWPAIFWINVPFGLLCIVVIVRFFNERIEPHTQTIDYGGSLLLAGGAGTLMFVLVMLGNLPGELAIGLSIVAAILIAWLIVHELRTPQPIMPLRLFRIRVIGISV